MCPLCFDRRFLRGSLPSCLAARPFFLQDETKNRLATARPTWNPPFFADRRASGHVLSRAARASPGAWARDFSSFPLKSSPGPPSCEVVRGPPPPPSPPRPSADDDQQTAVVSPPFLWNYEAMCLRTFTPTASCSNDLFGPTQILIPSTFPPLPS